MFEYLMYLTLLEMLVSAGDAGEIPQVTTVHQSSVPELIMPPIHSRSQMTPSEDLNLNTVNLALFNRVPISGQILRILT